MITIAVTSEDASEPRVAVSPDTVKKLAALGATVKVQSGAGLRSRVSDDAYKAAGATIAASADDAARDADFLLKVRRPSAAEVNALKPGAMVMAILDPYSDRAGLESLSSGGRSLFAMEFMPRITRAQSMDVLSSQANLAGYKAVVDAASMFEQAIPMMMTAAGTVPACKVFIMGVGVAGLQAIATARRLGAIVSATDVRPATKEQVASLGAKFIAVEDEEFKQAQTTAGYAKPMSAEYQAKQAELVANHIKIQDIVITTALIPGRPAPKLITRAMVDSMKPGAVIIDLAAERGGNCELTAPGKIVDHNGVRISRPDQPARQPAGQRLGALRQEPAELHRADVRQERQDAEDQLGRRHRQRHAGGQGRQDRAPEPANDGSVTMARLLGFMVAAMAAAVSPALAAGGHGGDVSPAIYQLMVFAIAIFVGYYVVWSVTPALHTPLMSVTNAISSVIVVGALLAAGVSLLKDGAWLAKIFGFLALIMACVNIFGGFLVTQRMLAMYKKKEPAKK